MGETLRAHSTLSDWKQKSDGPACHLRLLKMSFYAEPIVLKATYCGEMRRFSVSERSIPSIREALMSRFLLGKDKPLTPDDIRLQYTDDEVNEPTRHRAAHHAIPCLPRIQ